jgi:hypothetical protein
MTPPWKEMPPAPERVPAKTKGAFEEVPFKVIEELKDSIPLLKVRPARASSVPPPPMVTLLVPRGPLLRPLLPEIWTVMPFCKLDSPENVLLEFAQ